MNSGISCASVARNSFPRNRQQQLRPAPLAPMK
jgi:hypothetical protein